MVQEKETQRQHVLELSRESEADQCRMLATVKADHDNAMAVLMSQQSTIMMMMMMMMRGFESVRRPAMIHQTKLGSCIRVNLT